MNVDELNRYLLVAIADGRHRERDSGRVRIPLWLRTGPASEFRRYIRLLLRIEAVLTIPADLRPLRRDFTRAGGECICDQCELFYYQHPADVAGEPDVAGSDALTILCDRTRVKL